MTFIQDTTLPRFFWWLLVQKLLCVASHDSFGSRAIYETNITCNVSASNLEMICKWCPDSFKYTKWYDVQYTVNGSKPDWCPDKSDCECRKIIINPEDSFGKTYRFYFNETIVNHRSALYQTNGITLDYSMLQLPEVMNTAVKSHNSATVIITWDPVNIEAQLMDDLHYDVRINSSSLSYPRISTPCVVTNKTTSLEYSCNVGNSTSLNITSLEPYIMYTCRVCVVMFNSSSFCNAPDVQLPVAQTRKSENNVTEAPANMGDNTLAIYQWIFTVFGTILLLAFILAICWCFGYWIYKKYRIPILILVPNQITVDEPHPEEAVPLNSVIAGNCELGPVLPNSKPTQVADKTNCILKEASHTALDGSHTALAQTEAVTQGVQASDSYCETERCTRTESFKSGDTHPYTDHDTNTATDSAKQLASQSYCVTETHVRRGRYQCADFGPTVSITTSTIVNGKVLPSQLYCDIKAQTFIRQEAYASGNTCLISTGDTSPFSTGDFSVSGSTCTTDSGLTTPTTNSDDVDATVDEADDCKLIMASSDDGSFSADNNNPMCTNLTAGSVDCIVTGTSG